MDEEMANEMAKMVPTYDTYMRNITLGREQVLRDRTVELAQIKAGDCVLEVGCGTGTLTLAAKRKAGPTGQVAGIDMLPGMIEASRKKAALANQEITFQVGSIAEIPFSDKQFDAVMCSFMIFHMSAETRSKGIAEIYRVLKPGGRLLVVDLATPKPTVSRAIARLLLGFMLGHEPSELLPVMQSFGFTDLETGPVKFRVFGLPVVGYARGCAK
jgi:ubiquinone/menaquinone biosynthesis C-methylase UbiE